MLIKLLIRFLLRKQESYFRIIKVGNRNVSIDIEEYIPASEMIEKFEKRLHEIS